MRDERNAFDVTPTAAWRGTLEDTRSFLAEAPYRSALFGLPGFKLEYIRPDFMHTGCLGTTSYLLGSALYSLFKDLGGVQARPAPVLGRIQTMGKVMAAQLRRTWPLSDLTWGMIMGKKKARLKCTAAEARHLLPVVAYMCRTVLPLDTPRRELRANVLDAANDMYVEMEDWKEDSRIRLASACRRFLALYGMLFQMGADHPRGWGLYPKFHLLVHICEAATTNPRLEWCYGDETEIGVAKRFSKLVNVTAFNTAFIARYVATTHST